MDHRDLCVRRHRKYALPPSPRKNIIRDGDSTALYAANTFDTVGIVYTVDTEALVSWINGWMDGTGADGSYP